MDKNALESKIIDIFEKNDLVEHKDIRTDLHIVDEMGVDSITILELLMEINEQCDVEIADSEVDGLATISDIADLVIKKSKEK